MITLWENWVLLVWRRDKKISEDWRHCLSIFRLWWAPKQPPGPPMVPNGQPSVPWVVEIRCFTMGWFHFGKTKFYSLDWWTDEFRYVFAVFWLWGASSRARGLPMIPDGLPSVPWEVELKYFTMGWLYYGKNCVLHTWKVDKGITDDLRQCFSGVEGTPKGHWGQSGFPWEVETEYFTMGHCLKAMDNLFCSSPKCKKWENHKIQHFLDHLCPFITSKWIKLKT